MQEKVDNDKKLLDSQLNKPNNEHDSEIVSQIFYKISVIFRKNFLQPNMSHSTSFDQFFKIDTLQKKNQIMP